MKYWIWAASVHERSAWMLTGVDWNEWVLLEFFMKSSVAPANLRPSSNFTTPKTFRSLRDSSGTEEYLIESSNRTTIRRHKNTLAAFSRRIWKQLEYNRVTHGQTDTSLKRQWETESRGGWNRERKEERCDGGDSYSWVENLETGKKLFSDSKQDLREGGLEKKSMGWRHGLVSLSVAAQYSDKKWTGVLVMVRKWGSSQIR